MSRSSPKSQYIIYFTRFNQTLVYILRDTKVTSVILYKNFVVENRKRIFVTFFFLFYSPLTVDDKNRSYRVESL